MTMRASVQTTAALRAADDTVRNEALRGKAINSLPERCFKQDPQQRKAVFICFNAVLMTGRSE